MNNYKKILVLQTAFLGDVILSTPLIRALRQLYPNSHLDVLTIPETGIIFRANPYINEIIYFHKRSIFKKVISFISLVFKIRQKKYDLAISIQSSMTSSFLLLFGRIPERLGFTRQKFLILSVHHTKGLHKIQKILRLMEPLTDQKFDMQTEIFWTEMEEKKSKQILDKFQNKNKQVIGIAPGSIWSTKRWIKESYLELVKLLEKNNFQIVLIGGKEDFELCNFIKNDSNAINASGSFSILESAALIEKLDLLITNDSAPLHIANAVKTDVIAIFGPTVKELGFYPFRESDKVIEVDLDCRPCGSHGGNKCPLGHHNCMKFITAETVFNEVKDHLQHRLERSEMKENL
jgi:heptosyltransferase-2